MFLDGHDEKHELEFIRKIPVTRIERAGTV